MNYNKELELAKKLIIHGDYGKAIEIMAYLKNKDGENPNLLYDIGLLFGAMGQYKYALREINHSFDIEKNVDKLEMLAKLNMELFNYSDAAIQYEELIKHKNIPSVYEQCIEAYQKLEYDEEAIRIAKMMKDNFQDVNSYSRLNFMYMTAGMEKEAIAGCEEMKKKFHNHAFTYNMLGFLYECIYNDYDEAKKYFLKSAKLGFIDAYYNLGVCCKQSEDLTNAEKYLKKLINLDDKTQTNYNYTLGSIYFAQRKLKLGYKYYKKRKSINKITYVNRFRMWDGKEYPDKILYISTDQGFGDNIQFSRYIPFVLNKFKKVYYGVREPLITLFKRTYEEKYPNLEIVNINDIVEYNKFVTIMDLPEVLHKNFHEIPFSEPYMIPDKRKTDMYKTNFFNNDDIKIGLCWRSKGMELRDAVYRTIDAPYYFKEIMGLDNVKYYSFQTNDIFGMCDKYPQIINLAPTFNNFDDTAGALMNLDILITVDTALAHLAGALGIKTYLLLCHAPDWRWFDNTVKTEWYESVTIIKQENRKSWEDVSKKLTEFIKKDVSK